MYTVFLKRPAFYSFKVCDCSLMYFVVTCRYFSNVETKTDHNSIQRLTSDGSVLSKLSEMMHGGLMTHKGHLIYLVSLLVLLLSGLGPQ